jgi:DeoR/GlpR family transcriptional regulator of sugar metabolism
MARARKSDRQRLILNALRMAPALRVYDLAQRLSVSAETVRRDLAELDQAGLISRTYGGAMRPVPYEPGLAEREGLMVAERERIAEAALSLVAPDDILIIGGGATTLHFARRLAAKGERLTVITHAPSIAVALSANPGHRVLMLPGLYDGREGLIHGPDTIEALGRFRASTAFLGASGLTEEGPHDAAIGPGMVYAAMMRRASRTAILADHTKFDRPSLTVYGAWSPGVTLITDTAPQGALRAALESSGSGLLVAPPPAEVAAQ